MLKQHFGDAEINKICLCSQQISEKNYRKWKTIKIKWAVRSARTVWSRVVLFACGGRTWHHLSPYRRNSQLINGDIYCCQTCFRLYNCTVPPHPTPMGRCIPRLVFLSFLLSLINYIRHPGLLYLLFEYTLIELEGNKKVSLCNCRTQNAKLKTRVEIE